MRVVWSPLAIERASEAASYVAAENPQAARVWVDRLFEKIERVARFPQSGRIVPEVRRQNVREVVFRGYRVIYRLERSRLLILTLRHVRRAFHRGELT